MRPNKLSFPHISELKGKTLLGVDYGQKVTGIALYTHERDPYPMPFSKIIYQNDSTLTDEISRIIQDECVDLLVLGIPIRNDGSDSKMTQKIRQFGASLYEFVKIPLYYQDEGLSSYEAKERMKNSARYNFQVDPKQIDALAASIILEDFFKNIS